MFTPVVIPAHRPLPAYPQLQLDKQLCFALYAATNAVTRAYRKPLAQLGLTYPQYLAMLVLWQHGGQTVKGLADALLLDSSTLTPLLKRLEAGGLIDRRRDSVDERIVRISLTAAGSAMQQAVAVVQQSVACQTRLLESELVDLRARLHALVESMTAADLVAVDP